MTLAVVTGAGRGIGRSAALALAARGADLVLIGRTPDELGEVGALARTQHAVVHTLVADLASTSETEAAARSILAIGTPDAVVHNAAVIERASVEETTTASWERQFAVNALSHGTIFDDALPYDSKAWALPFVVAAPEVATN